MYAEASWLGRAAPVQNLLHYFTDTSHRDHRDKTIGPVVEVGIDPDKSPLEMLLSHIAACDSQNRRIRRGRKIKRKVQHIRLDHDLIEAIENMATALSKTDSEIIRWAIRRGLDLGIAPIQINSTLAVKEDLALLMGEVRKLEDDGAQGGDIFCL